MERLFGSPTASDVVAVVLGSNGERDSTFHLHKFPLVARSLLFKGVFESNPSGIVTPDVLASLFPPGEDYSSMVRAQGPSVVGSKRIVYVVWQLVLE